MHALCSSPFSVVSFSYSMNNNVEGSSQEAQIKPAGFWVRFLAQFIDGIIVQAIIFSVVLVVFFVVSVAYQGGLDFEQIHDGVAILFLAVVPIVVVILWVRWHGRTPGKALLRIRIVRLDGKDLTPKDAILRYLAYIPSWLLFFVNFFMLGFRKDKRALHDLMAKTKVIDEE